MAEQFIGKAAWARLSKFLESLKHNFQFVLCICFPFKKFWKELAFSIYVLPNTLKLVCKVVAECPYLTSWKFFVSTDHNDIVLFISSNNLGCSLLLSYTLNIRKICNFGLSKLKASDSAEAFLISSNFIYITLHMQATKQLDKFSWSKCIKPL